MYKILLIDLDNTLLDFDLAQRKALVKTLEKYGVEPSNENVELFRKINTFYWEEYEKGRITKPELLVKRFDEFFSIFKLKRDCEEANTSFLLELSYGSDIIENADVVLEKLFSKVDIYAVTNGVYNTQKRRVEESGLRKYFSDIFVSEKIGYQKPRKEFFDFVFESLSNKYKKTNSNDNTNNNINNNTNNNINYLKEKTIVVGDSLSADIIGGIEYGLDTCWYNPKGKTTDLKPTYIIDNILSLLDIIK